VSAVVFDVGETLVDETAAWEAVAVAAHVSCLALFGVLGGLAAAGEDHRRAFEILGVEAPPWTGYGQGDLYPDALPCLERLRAEGYLVGIAGNQPRSCEAFLDEAGFDVDFVGSSSAWHVEKPAPAFFERIAAEAGLTPAEIAYVGDRVDNDVVPAADAGMVAVHVRRGPWGYLHARWPEVERAVIRLDSLAGLPEALAHV